MCRRSSSRSSCASRLDRGAAAASCFRVGWRQPPLPGFRQPPAASRPGSLFLSGTCHTRLPSRLLWQRSGRSGEGLSRTGQIVAPAQHQVASIKFVCIAVICKSQNWRTLNLIRLVSGSCGISRRSTSMLRERRHLCSSSFKHRHLSFERRCPGAIVSPEIPIRRRPPRADCTSSKEA